MSSYFMLSSMSRSLFGHLSSKPPRVNPPAFGERAAAELREARRPDGAQHARLFDLPGRKFD